MAEANLVKWIDFQTYKYAKSLSNSRGTIVGEVCTPGVALSSLKALQGTMLECQDVQPRSRDRLNRDVCVSTSVTSTCSVLQSGVLATEPPVTSVENQNNVPSLVTDVAKSVYSIRQSSEAASEGRVSCEKNIGLSCDTGIIPKPELGIEENCSSSEENKNSLQEYFRTMDVTPKREIENLGATSENCENSIQERLTTDGDDIPKSDTKTIVICGDSEECKHTIQEGLTADRDVIPKSDTKTIVICGDSEECKHTIQEGLTADRDVIPKSDTKTIVICGDSEECKHTIQQGLTTVDVDVDVVTPKRDAEAAKVCDTSEECKNIIQEGLNIDVNVIISKLNMETISNWENKNSHQSLTTGVDVSIHKSNPETTETCINNIENVDIVQAMDVVTPKPNVETLETYVSRYVTSSDANKNTAKGDFSSDRAVSHKSSVTTDIRLNSREENKNVTEESLASMYVLSEQSMEMTETFSTSGENLIPRDLAVDVISKPDKERSADIVTTGIDLVVPVAGMEYTEQCGSYEDGNNRNPDFTTDTDQSNVIVTRSSVETLKTCVLKKGNTVKTSSKKARKTVPSVHRSTSPTDADVNLSQVGGACNKTSRKSARSARARIRCWRRKGGKFKIPNPTDSDYCPAVKCSRRSRRGGATNDCCAASVGDTYAPSVAHEVVASCGILSRNSGNIENATWTRISNKQPIDTSTQAYANVDKQRNIDNTTEGAAVDFNVISTVSLSNVPTSSYKRRKRIHYSRNMSSKYKCFTNTDSISDIASKYKSAFGNEYAGCKVFRCSGKTHIRIFKYTHKVETDENSLTFPPQTVSNSVSSSQVAEAGVAETVPVQTFPLTKLKQFSILVADCRSKFIFIILLCWMKVSWEEIFAEFLKILKRILSNMAQNSKPV